MTASPLKTTGSVRKLVRYLEQQGTPLTRRKETIMYSKTFFFFFNFYSPSGNCFMFAYNMLKNNFHCRSEKFCQIILVAQYMLPALFQLTTNQKKILLLDFDLQEIHIPLWIFCNLVGSVSTFPFIVS